MAGFAATSNRSLRNGLFLFVMFALILVGWFTRQHWMPLLTGALASATSVGHQSDAHEGHGHDHGHAHGGEETSNTLVLSEQARLNLGLKVGPVEPEEYWRKMVVPGQVANLPGHSERRINATVQGTILKSYVVQGQTVRPGDPLFEVRVTSELLATAQSNLLRTLQEIELNQAEIKRIKPVSESGAASQKLLLEKEYEKRRLETARQVQLQELTIRGLTSAQVKKIVDDKTLLRQFTVRVPEKAALTEESDEAQRVQPEKPIDAETSIQQTVNETTQPANDDNIYVIERMDVFPGKLVNPGDELCDLAQHSELQIRGEAFETESAQIYEALTNHWPITAVFDLGDQVPLTRENLSILYASSVTNPQARSFEFFIPLTNDVIRDLTGPDGRSYRSWRFKPGQRVQLLVPVERWSERFVLPSEAVVTEGADSFVFKVNGKLLERQPVVIEYRDARQTVLANDGSVFPGDEIALNQAYSLNLA